MFALKELKVWNWISQIVYLLPENNALIAFCWSQEAEIVTALMTIRKEKMSRGPYLIEMKLSKMFQEIFNVLYSLTLKTSKMHLV